MHMLQEPELLQTLLATTGETVELADLQVRKGVCFFLFFCN